MIQAREDSGAGGIVSAGMSQPMGGGGRWKGHGAKLRHANVSPRAANARRWRHKRPFDLSSPVLSCPVLFPTLSRQLCQSRPGRTGGAAIKHFSTSTSHKDDTTHHPPEAPAPGSGAPHDLPWTPPSFTTASPRRLCAHVGTPSCVVLLLCRLNTPVRL
jgi:hypothetical protein